MYWLPPEPSMKSVDQEPDYTDGVGVESTMYIDTEFRGLEVTNFPRRYHVNSLHGTPCQRFLLTCCNE